MYIDDNPHCKLKNEQKKFLYGVSFWSTKEAVQEVKRRYPRPNQFGNKKIALISFTKELGKMVVDQPSRNHISLWKQFGHCPSSCFVKEEL